MTSAVQSTNAGGERITVPCYVCLSRKRHGRLKCDGHFISEHLARPAVERVLVRHLEALNLQQFLRAAADEEASLSEGEAS